MEQRPVTKDLRNFGLIVGGVFSVIGLWPAIVRNEDPRLWSLALGGMLIALGLVMPRSLKQIHFVWMKIGHVLGTINTRIILGIIYYGLITPMGMIMRFMGKDSMRRVLIHDATTYRVIRAPRLRDHMRNQF
jgi:saxitoxin biosynthesis operon SxtJ-like protein